MNIEISPKLIVAAIVIVVVIAGFLFYRGVSGPSPALIEQNIESMHQKMMPFPGKQASSPQPPATPQPATR
jgi:hypothetical protein